MVEVDIGGGEAGVAKQALHLLQREQEETVATDNTYLLLDVVRTKLTHLARMI